MNHDLIKRVRRLPRVWWWRLRKGSRHRAHRREAGMTRELSWYECYGMALKAFEVALESSDEDVERELARMFLPLSEYEMTRTAQAMAVLARPKFMGWLKQDEIESMQLFLDVHWQPEMDRWSWERKA